MQEWYIDTASNTHVVGDKRYFIRYRELSRDEATVRGVAPSFQGQPVGVGTILLETSVAGKTVLTVIDDVLLVPGARNPLLSMGRALDDGFKFEWDSNAHRFTILKNDESVALADKVGAVWVFEGQVALGKQIKPHLDTRVRTFTARNGVGNLQLCHKRLGHICPQYIKLMVDRKLVDGMMLSGRDVRDCETCHVAKQVRKTF